MAADKYAGPNSITELWAKIKANFSNGAAATTTATTASVQLKNASNENLGSAATIPAATTSAAGVMTADDRTKLNGITAGAQPNQNAFSTVKVGTTNVAADSATDTLELVAGSNVTLTPDATNDKVTIAATDTTYSDATTSAHGLMTAADKTKLNGIAAGAEVNQNAFSNVKVGSTTVAADTKTDTLELVAGSNVTLTPDTTNDKVTIAAADMRTVDVWVNDDDGTYGADNGMLGFKATSPISVAGSQSTTGEYSVTVSHASSGVTAGSKGDTASQTPGCGSTFKALSGTVNATGHLTAFEEHTVTIPSAAATTSAAGLMSAADKTKLNGIPTNPLIYHATCPTAAATAAKVATLDNATGFSLVAGVVVAVTFQYGNSAATPTLNVNSTGAKNVAIPSSATAQTTGSGTTYNSWGAYETLLFTYNGTQWVHMGSGYLQYQAFNKANAAAPKVSPALTGTPTAPTAATGTNTTQIATTAFVVAEISSELANITGIDFQVVTALPATGVKGTIYLVSNGGSGTNGYDEYIWLSSASRFEKIGTTEVDLSGYATTSALTTGLAGKQDTMAEMTAAEIDAICV